MQTSQTKDYLKEQHKEEEKIKQREERREMTEEEGVSGREGGKMGSGVDVSSEAAPRPVCVKANFIWGNLTLTGDFHLPKWGKKSGKVLLTWKTWA